MDLPKVEDLLSAALVALSKKLNWFERVQTLHLDVV
jgi:hypothetical protein